MAIANILRQKLFNMFTDVGTSTAVNTAITGPDGTPVKVTNGGLDVNIQDQFTDIVDVFLHDASIASPQNIIASNTAVGDNIITLVTGHGGSVGDTLCLKEENRIYQGKIIAITGDDITVNTSLDYAYDTGAIGCIGVDNMAVDGSAVERVFFITPPLNTIWDITRIIFVILDSDSMDDGKFGGITGGITNGFTLRKTNSEHRNIFTIHSNEDFRLRAYDVNYLDGGLGPSGLNSVSSRRTFAGQNKNGVTIRLDSTLGDKLEIVIRDNLTSLYSFKAVVQGHVVE